MFVLFLVLWRLQDLGFLIVRLGERWERRRWHEGCNEFVELSGSSVFCGESGIIA